ncbi:hypothetical protein [Plantactinospora sp. GCM10030261]|uniref:hypothetical protein n=1 Tax=Plantactinospora sp. GCM10030261 TaxID=3273420 RepID=UPI00360895B9
MSPGLSGLLPRWLAGRAGGPVETLRVWAGGLERFSPAAAADMVDSVHGGYGEPLAAWRDGAAVARAATPTEGVRLPPFPGRVTTYPFLSGESRRVAASLGVRHGDFHNVFPGQRTFAVLSRLRAEPDTGHAVAARRLARAGDADLAGHRPYQLMVVEVRAGKTVTATVRADDGYRVTAAVAAAATTAVLGGTVPAGAGWADDVLDPATVLTGVAAVCAVFEVADGPLEDAVEEVVL